MKNRRTKPDVIFKNFWRDNGRFASLFNTVVFHGKAVVKPEELNEMDTDVSNLLKEGGQDTTIERARDVIKKSTCGADFVILGIENQYKTHYGMPLRVMIYDSLSYLKEYREIVKGHREAGHKATSEEFLSGLHKEDRLHPVISIVIYYNDKPWDGPRSLKDMVTDMPEEIAGAFSDYKMNLLEARESGRYHFENEDVQTVFEVTRYIYNGEFDKVRQVCEEKTIDPDVGAMIGVMTDSRVLVQSAIESEGGMNMCTALEQLEERGREAGRTEGIAAGKRELLFALLKEGADVRMLRKASGLSEEEIEEMKRQIK